MDDNAAIRAGNVVHNQNNFEIERSKVELASCGAILSGILLTPKGERGALPAIVMAPGMSGVKEGSILKYGEYFARGGFAVLAFDNINFGESGGETRQEVDPTLQRRGYRDAITYIGSRPEVDKTRIGLFGTSYSGGHVLEVAAHDRRVKCLVSQIPAISGFKAFQRLPRHVQAAALKAQDEDREQRYAGEPPRTLKAVSDDPTEPCAMPGLAAYEYFMEQQKIAPNWKNYLTLRSMDLYRGVDNSVFTPWISPTPLLMIVALNDDLAWPDLALDAYDQAKEPKKLVMLPGNHFSPYEAEFSLTGNEARDWFTRHMMIGGSVALN
ncbi:alpha/beta hydrolase [Bradyrhizobium erythrophlei]|uniref:Xaa-Pro dipeptidyl-peptidase-like domain-containing protein n=1 Tax=Bradyrhizobium erythrophlei TaxID=1437360 RepID=A0A1H4WT83_9BRAD|nr:alpha/beta hydrolase [Bradyrhizobium erythrophlei]SEC95938.1 hypothetical protein SAMN05444164_3220 [Bradyrhizobium erythrophlei]